MEDRVAFSPLFIGVIPASPVGLRAIDGMTHFQSPFHRGNPCIPLSWVLQPPGLRFQSPFHRGNPCIPMNSRLHRRNVRSFQSPFHRGNPCIPYAHTPPAWSHPSFSPLFIGVIPASSITVSKSDLVELLSVPFSSG